MGCEAIAAPPGRRATPFRQARPRRAAWFMVCMMEGVGIMLVYIDAHSPLRRRVVRYSRPRGGPGREDVSSRGGRKALSDAWGSARLVAIADTFCRGRNGAE